MDYINENWSIFIQISLIDSQDDLYRKREHKDI